jgi:RimJ/RimL family protein N-acetyltransferase
MVREILSTRRLRVRELSLDDLDFIATQLAHPEVMRFWPQTYTREEAEAWIRRQMAWYEKSGLGYWLALDLATGEPVGQVGLLPVRHAGHNVPDIGYLIHRPFWRRGLASEGAAGIRDWAFATLGLPVIKVFIRPENLPSQGVAQKIGAIRQEGILQIAGFDHWIYEIAKPSLDKP